jgi:hypothetical protein
MQRDCNTLCDVFIVYVNLYLHLKQISSSTTYGDAILKDLESRWSVEEVHLFFLSFILHPKYQMYLVSMINSSEEINDSWTKGKNVLSANRIITAAKFYFGKHKLYIDCMKNSVSGSALACSDDKNKKNDHPYRGCPTILQNGSMGMLSTAV